MPFITVEGMDGSGKSVLINRIHTALISSGRQCHVSREPGGTQFAEKLRELVLSNGNISNLTQLLIMSAARSDHVEKVIKPFLDRNEFVLCSRFIDSTFAYQCYAPDDEVCERTLFAISNIPTSPLATDPDITFLLDAPVSVCLKRMRKGEDKTDVFQERNAEFFEKLRKAYLRISSVQWQRVVLIDAEQSEEDVYRVCLQHLKKKFNI